MKLRLIVALLALLAAVACSEPLEFADWTIPVPEGTRIIECGPVSDEERADHVIELEKDLVLGNDAGGAVFFRPALASSMICCRYSAGYGLALGIAVLLYSKL